MLLTLQVPAHMSMKLILAFILFFLPSHCVQNV